MSSILIRDNPQWLLLLLLLLSISTVGLFTTASAAADDNETTISNHLFHFNNHTKYFTDASIQSLKDTLAITSVTKVVHIQITIPQTWIESSSSQSASRIKKLLASDQDDTIKHYVDDDDDNGGSSGGSSGSKNGTTTPSTRTKNVVHYYLEVKLVANATLMWMLPYTRLFTFGTIDEKMSFVRLHLRDNLTYVVNTTTTTTTTTTTNGSGSTREERLINLDSFKSMYELNLFATTAVFKTVDTTKWFLCFGEMYRIRVWSDDFYCYAKKDFRLNSYTRVIPAPVSISYDDDNGDGKNDIENLLKVSMSGYLLFTQVTFGMMTHVIVAYTFYFVLQKLNFLKKISQQKSRHGELQVTNSFYEPPFFPNIFPRLLPLKLRVNFRFWEGFVLLCFHALLYFLITLTCFTPLTWAGKREGGNSGGGYIATNFLWLKLPLLFLVIGVNLSSTLFKILVASNKKYQDSFQSLFSIGNMIVLKYKQEQQMMMLDRMRAMSAINNGSDSDDSDSDDDDDDADEKDNDKIVKKVKSAIASRQLTTNNGATTSSTGVSNSNENKDVVVDNDEESDQIDDFNDNQLEASFDFEDEEDSASDDDDDAGNDNKNGGTTDAPTTSATTSRKRRATKLLLNNDNSKFSNAQQEMNGRADVTYDDEYTTATDMSGLGPMNQTSFSIKKTAMKLKSRNKSKGRSCFTAVFIFLFKLVMGMVFGGLISGSVGVVSFFVFRPFVHPFLYAEVPCFALGFIVLSVIFMRYPFRTWIKHVQTLMFKGCFKKRTKRSAILISEKYEQAWYRRVWEAFTFTLGTVVIDFVWIWTLYLLSLNIGVVISRLMFSTIANLVVDTSTVPMYSYFITLATTIYTFLVETHKPFIGVKEMLLQSREPATLASMKNQNARMLKCTPEEIEKRFMEKYRGYPARFVVHRVPMTWRVFLSVCEMAHVETIAQAKISQMVITLVVLCTLFLGVSVFDVNFFGGKNSQLFTVLGGSLLPLIPTILQKMTAATSDLNTNNFKNRVQSAIEKLEDKQRTMEFANAAQKLHPDFRYRFHIVNVVSDRKKALQGLSKLKRTVTRLKTSHSDYELMAV